MTAVPLPLEIDAEAPDPLPEKEALSAFRTAIRQNPADPDYFYILGGALAQLGRYEEALSALREATRSFSGDPAYHRALGAVLWRLSRHEEALEAFHEVLRRVPDDLGALNGMAVTELSRGRMEHAIAGFERMLRLDRGCAAAHANLAAAFRAGGRPDDAERALREAVRLRPDHVTFRRSLGETLLDLGRPAEALVPLREALRLRPEDAEAHTDVADALMALGRTAEADEAYERGLQLDPKVLASRPRSQEARRTLLLDRVRAEVKGEMGDDDRVARAVAAGVSGVGEALDRAAGHGGFRPPRARTLVGLALVAALVSLGLAFLPPYLMHYTFEDEVAAIARVPNPDDGQIRARIVEVAMERPLDRELQDSDVLIETRGGWRRVRFDYSVSRRLLPGLVRTLRFQVRVEVPVLFEPAPVHH